MGKKGKGKKAKEPLPLLAEVEREMFQLHINDITRKLERITAKCLELEKSNEEYERMYKKLDEDRGDVITYLKRTLQEKSDEAKKLQETVDQLTAERTAMQEMFAAKIAQMEHEFKVMQEQLTGDIKLLTGRLKALEHFRVHQDELMNKFKQQEIEIEEREKEHKRMLYEVEKKFIIAKDKAMKDMEVRQLQLSSEFEATTQMCIAASTKRAIRENIAVNNELNKLKEFTHRLVKDNEKLKERDRDFRIEKELIEGEKDILMQENTEHLKIISSLTQQYEEATEQMGQLTYAARRLPEVEMKVQHLRSELSAVQQQSQILKQQLHGAQYLQTQLQRQAEEARTWASTLEAVLDTAANEIKNAIMGAEHTSQTGMTTEEKDFALEERDSLLNTLLDLIRGNLIEFSKLTPKKNLRSTACSAMYLPGNLGIISKISSVTEKTVTKEEIPTKSELDIEPPKVPSDFSEKTSILGQMTASRETDEISGKQEEMSKASVEQVTEVVPIEKKGSSVIRASSIFTHSSSILKDISSAMLAETESEELDDILPLNSGLTEVSSTSNLSKKSSLRSRSSEITQRSVSSQERSKVRFQDTTTDAQEQKPQKQTQEKTDASEQKSQKQSEKDQTESKENI